jgi:hypothetical protein
VNAIAAIPLSNKSRSLLLGFQRLDYSSYVFVADRGLPCLRGRVPETAEEPETSNAPMIAVRVLCAPRYRSKLWGKPDEHL